MTRGKGTAAGVVAIATWSFYGVLIASNSATPPFLSMAIVFSFATAVLLAPRLIQGKGFRALLQTPLRTVGLGVLGLFGSNCLYVLALSLGGEPVAVNIVSLSWPLLMGVILVGSRIARATWLDVVAMLIGLAGVILLSLQHGAIGIDWPVLVAFGGALSWATYSALRTKVPAGPSDAITVFVAVSGLLCWIIALSCERAVAPWDEVFRLALVGIFPVGLANLAWDQGARYGDPILLAGMSFLEPLISTMLIAFLLDKPITLAETIALAMVLTAVFFSVMSERLRRRRLRAAIPS